MGAILGVLMLSFVPSAAAADVTLTTSDGVSLAAQSWGSGSDGVLLLHGEHRTREDWAALASRLATQGFQVLAVDLRGHGGSKSAEANFTSMAADVSAGVAWLEAAGATTIHGIGASFGANLVLSAAGDHPQIADVVLLSPQLNAQGLTVSGAVASYGSRPMLVVASNEDTLSVRAASYLDTKAAGPHHLQLYDGAGTGARMLNGAPDLETLVVSWVNGTFLRSADPTAAQQAAVKTGEMNELETSGTLLEDRDR